MKAKTKKAQQEIFGFVIIILLVIVIGIIILTFSLQRSLRKPTFVIDVKVNDLLNAVMHYTTGCKNKKISEIIGIVVVNSNEECDDENAKTYLENILKNILNASFPGLEYGYLNGYNLTIFTQPLISITSGKLEGNVVVGSYIIPVFAEGQASNIEARLYLYYSGKKSEKA